MKENRLPYRNKTGFQIPQDYLENLEERIMSKVYPMEVGEPTIENRAFTVPPGYFDSLEDRVMQNIEGQKQPRVLSFFTRKAIYYVAGVAAVFLAIITNISAPQAEPQSLDNLDLLSLETYLEETIDYSNPELSGLISGDIFFATSSQSSYIDQEAVMDYLHENLEEPSLIFNEK